MPTARERETLDTQSGDGDCSWCGADLADPEPGTPGADRPGGYANREGERFCCPNHRTASNRARNRLMQSTQPEPPATV